ncbi:TetR family transcriptional regulator [Streptomyces sp. NPDC091272]|uniref:TetR family transcriptional regulator n=1 Tax=Streptomyces sp. NPDC091272 TaxID=3365981 RepID=UPI00381E8990
MAEKMTQQERSHRTRQGVLDLAAEEFATVGYQAANLKVVARRLGVTTGALYGHFPSKEALAEALTRQAASDWAEMCARAEADGGGDPRQVLRAATGALMRRLAEPRFRAALRLAADARPDAGEEGADLLERMHGHLLHELHRAERSGRLTPPWRPESAAQVLFALVCGATFGGRAAGEVGRWPEVARTVLDVICGP